MQKNKKEKSIRSIFIISVLLFLFIPIRIIQFIGLTVFCIITISFFYANILANNIKVERRISKIKVACREKFDISLIIKNNSNFSAHVCYIFDDAPYLLVFNRKNSEIVTLRPKEIKKITYTVSAQQRGLYQAGPVKIKLSDPIGLFDKNIEIDNNLEIIVRPARIKLITQAFPGLPQGKMKINNAIYEDITQRRAIRQYINGDEQRRINWKATAKLGNIYTNVFENTFDTTFFIFLNLAQDDYELHSRYTDSEKAIEIAACIAEKARELHQSVGFASYGSNFPYLKPAQNQTDNILDILTFIKLEPGKLSYNPYKFYKSQLPNGTIFFVIGPDEVRKYFNKVEKNEEKITAENIGAYKKDNRSKSVRN